MAVGFLSPAVRGDGPHDFLVSEVGRDGHAKNPRMPPCQEIGWLTLIRRARLQSVIRPRRDRELFFVIPVHVSEDQRESAVRIPDPAIERWNYVLSFRELRLRNVGGRGRLRAQGCSG